MIDCETIRHFFFPSLIKLAFIDYQIIYNRGDYHFLQQSSIIITSFIQDQLKSKPALVKTNSSQDQF